MEKRNPGIQRSAEQITIRYWSFQEIMERLIREEMQRKEKKESTGVVLWMKRSAGSSRQEEKRQLPVREKKNKKQKRLPVNRSLIHYSSLSS